MLDKLYFKRRAEHRNADAECKERRKDLERRFSIEEAINKLTKINDAYNNIIAVSQNKDYEAHVDLLKEQEKADYECKSFRCSVTVLLSIAKRKRPNRAVELESMRRKANQ